MSKKSIDKWQFGDFQTPKKLAHKIVDILKVERNIKPDIILEPTCGTGAFIEAALTNFENCKLFGFDINQSYIEQAEISIQRHFSFNEVTLQYSDFFEKNWKKFLPKMKGYILILGNPPWVTSSELSILNSRNFPKKSNFQNRRGIESITGSGNFDISEWMLLQYVDWLSSRDGTIAVLCKYSVARKVMKSIEKNSKRCFSSSIYEIDAKAYFGASVRACCFILSTSLNHSDCAVYDNLDSKKPCYLIGERNGWIIRDTTGYEKWKHLAGQDLKYVWRSGIKHDCSKVMELEKVGDFFKNGFGNQYSLESEYLYPLLKSSDIGNSRTNTYRKLLLVTQKFVGEETSKIKTQAPQTWQYLLTHDEYLRKRKSSIYKNRPSYSIFGIGDYTFKKWKIAVSGFYKKLNFCLIGNFNEKPVLFDDTVNFLSFDTEEEARFIFTLLTSQPALEFLSSMIFWDDKRPISIDILRRLSIKEVATELGMLDRYIDWAGAVQVTPSGQLKLGLA